MLRLTTQYHLRFSFNFQKPLQNIKKDSTGYSNNSYSQKESKIIHRVSYRKENNNAGIRSLSQPVLISNNTTRQDSLENIQKEQLVFFLYLFFQS